MLRGSIRVYDLSGGLAGRTFLGDFSYDDSQLTRNGIEIMGVNAGGVNNYDVGGFKTFNFNFVDLETVTNSTFYTQTDINEFNEFGAIAFEDALPVTLVNIGITGGTDSFGFGFTGDFIYILGGKQANGTVNEGIGRIELKIVSKEIPL